MAHDREGPRNTISPLNVDLLKYTFSSESRIKDIKNIVATRDLESLFFHDIEGIFNYLRVPKSKRNARKYNNVEAFNHSDLSKLFRDHDKYYQKGMKVEGFLKSLDIDKIVTRTKELQEFVKCINSLCLK